VDPGAEDVAVGRDQELDAARESLDVRAERAEAVAERGRKHRDDAVDEVRRVAAPLRFAV
jgi:signal transduction histidine kinase